MYKISLFIVFLISLQISLFGQSNKEYSVESALSEKHTTTYLRIDLKVPNESIDPRITEFKKLEEILLVVENQREVDLSILKETPITSIEIQLYVGGNVKLTSKDTLEKLTNISINNRDAASTATLQFLERTKNVESLGFWKMSLSKLPETVYDMKNLKYLYLTGNQISSFEQEISQLQLLEDIRLGYWQDMEFMGNPIDGNGIAALAQLPNLHVLEMMGCDQLFLEDVIAQLKQKELVVYFTKDQCREKSTFNKYSEKPYGAKSQIRSMPGVKGLFVKKQITYYTEPNKTN
jgi:hypothetical protein